jgi:alpha-tubulin suppressor-like RCC1 family protein
VLTGAGDTLCWGSNEHGQLAQGTTGGLVPTPVAVALAAPVKSIVAGQWHTCALLLDGTVRCWGEGGSGQLGNDQGIGSPQPVIPRLDPSLEVVELAAGGDVTCAITSDRTLRCWGDNTFGEIGDGTNLPRYAPVPVSDLAGRVRGVAVGRWSTCAVTMAGKAYCWGRNDQGQLGDGTLINRASPVAVQGL